MKFNIRLLMVALLVLVLVLSGVMITRYRETPVFSHFVAKQEIPVLMYHKVNPSPSTGGFGLRVPPKQFAWQMKYLRKRGFKAITFNDLVRHWEKGTTLPVRPVIVTFDDGYQDNFIFAYPILKNNHFTATIFLVSGLIGKTNEWDTKVHSQPKNKLLTWSQIRLMEKYGIEFGAHTVTHPSLTNISPDSAFSEITLCKETLEKELGHPVVAFAYPYGHYNDTTKSETAKAGFKAAVTTTVGVNPLAPADHFTLKRLRVTGYTTQDKFIRMMEK